VPVLEIKLRAVPGAGNHRTLQLPPGEIAPHVRTTLIGDIVLATYPDQKKLPTGGSNRLHDAILQVRYPAHF
jgi:hypothetical protein